MSFITVFILFLSITLFLLVSNLQFICPINLKKGRKKETREGKERYLYSYEKIYVCKKEDGASINIPVRIVVDAHYHYNHAHNLSLLVAVLWSFVWLNLSFLSKKALFILRQRFNAIGDIESNLKDMKKLIDETSLLLYSSFSSKILLLFP
mgnify:CR=1 FL=1